MDFLSENVAALDSDAAALREHWLNIQAWKEREEESLRVRKVELEAEFEQLKASLEADFKRHEEDLLHSVEVRTKELDERGSALAQWEQHAKVLEALEDELKAERDRSEELQRLLEIGDVKLEDKEQEVEMLGIQLDERREESRVLQSELDRTTADLKCLQSEVGQMKKQAAPSSNGRQDAWEPRSRGAKSTRMPSSQVFQKSFFRERPSFRRSNSFAASDNSLLKVTSTAATRRDREFVPVSDGNPRLHNGSSRFAPYQRHSNTVAAKSKNHACDAWAAHQPRPARELSSFAVSLDTTNNNGPKLVTPLTQPSANVTMTSSAEQESGTPAAAVKRTFSQASIDSYVRYFREGLATGMQFDDIAKYLEGLRGKDTVEHLVPIIRKALM